MRATTRVPSPRTARTHGALQRAGATAGQQATPLELRLRRAYVTHALDDALPQRRSWLLNRSLDVIIALPLALLTAPLCLLVALALWARYRQPPITWRECAVRGGATHALPVFRFNRDTEYHGEKRLEVWPDGSRLNRILALWSVLSGKLSLVGPCPWPSDAYDTAPTEELARLRVAPGVARLRAVGSLSRLAASAEEADRRYVTHGSLWMDLQQLAAVALMRQRYFSPGTRVDERADVHSDG